MPDKTRTGRPSRAGPDPVGPFQLDLMQEIVRNPDAHGARIIQLMRRDMSDMQDSQVYVALNRLERRGLISGMGMNRNGAGRPKKTYSLTDAGRETLSSLTPDVRVPTVRIDEVFHVGSLDPSTRSDRSSLEAFMVSVSVDPEIWSSIARTSGNTWSLTCEGAQYLDVMSLYDTDVDAIRAWGLDRGYIEPATIWRSWDYDDEFDNWRYMVFTDEDMARLEIEDLDNDEAALAGIPSESGTRLDRVDDVILTGSGLSALERWNSPVDAMDGLAILWAREVALPQHPEMVGVWWREDMHPEALSCPRGGVFPERLDRFEIENEHGQRPPEGFLTSPQKEDLGTIEP